MAKLYIKEYKELRGVDGGLAQIGQEPGTAQAPLSFTTAAASAVFGEGTKMVRIVSDTKCHLVFGDAPVATVNEMIVAADAAEYFGVIQGQKVSAIVAV